MSVSLKQLRYFVAAAETGQISSAATELNISQSAVTIAIQQLEITFGTRLLNRGPHGVTVTHEGGILLARARAIMQSLEECVSEVRKAVYSAGRKLRVGCSPTASGYFLPPHLAKFKSRSPDAVIELFEGTRSAIEKGLFEGELDVAIVLLSNLAPEAPFFTETLLRSPRHLWVSKSHPLLKSRSITLADVALYPYVMLTSDEANTATLSYWSSLGLQPKTVFRTSSIDAVRSMVASGLGVTILSDLIYSPRSFDNKPIEVLELSDRVPSMDVGLIWRKDQKLSSEAEEFCKFLISSVDPG